MLLTITITINCGNSYLGGNLTVKVTKCHFQSNGCCW